jgi:hypothetical protein
MTFEHALIIFDKMDRKRRDRVARIFNLSWGSPAFSDWREAFVQAVEDEADAIECEMLLKQETEGAA